MRKHKKEIDLYKEKCRQEIRNEAIDFLSESGIHSEFYERILYFLPSHYKRFVCFIKNQKLEITDVLKDLEYFSLNMYLSDYSKDERQCTVLNALEQYYQANNFFRDEKPPNVIVTVFHDEVKSLTVKMENGVHFQVGDLPSELRGMSWTGLETDWY